jgi:hypothetical protein
MFKTTVEKNYLKKIVGGGKRHIQYIEAEILTEITAAYWDLCLRQTEKCVI